MKRRAPPLLLMLLATVLAVTPYLLPWALIQWSSVPTTPYVYIPPMCGSSTIRHSSAPW